MKLGFVSAILPDLDRKDVFRIAKESGYSCVELMCWPQGRAERRYAGVTHVNAADMTDDRAKGVLDEAAAAGVEISGLGYYPNPLSPDADESRVATDHLRQVILAAAKLKVGVVNTFIGKDWKRSTDENWPRFREVWPPLVRFAADLGVRIAIENCPMYFTKDEWPGGKNLASSPALWRRMFDEIPDPGFGLNFDPSHLVWQGIDYLKAAREFAGRIFHAHAKDCRVDRHRLDEVGILATPLEFHTPKLPGLGDVKWGKLISVLGDAGYDGPVCVEVEDRTFEASLEKRRAALNQSRAFLRQFIPE
ncbi:MAG: sugar phosphate isomerase/epimerase [bacterium]|nr:sugar phosphate isomerase/epimerase [bacterium]